MSSIYRCLRLQPGRNHLERKSGKILTKIARVYAHVKNRVVWVNLATSECRYTFFCPKNDESSLYYSTLNLNTKMNWTDVFFKTLRRDFKGAVSSPSDTCTGRRRGKRSETHQFSDHLVVCCGNWKDRKAKLNTTVLDRRLKSAKFSDCPLIRRLYTKNFPAIKRAPLLPSSPYLTLGEMLKRTRPWLLAVSFSADKTVRGGAPLRCGRSVLRGAYLSGNFALLCFRWSGMSMVWLERRRSMVKVSTGLP